MSRPVRPQAAGRLLELALAAGPIPASSVQPRNRDVDEALQEVALRGGRLAPLVLELLVRLEVVPRADELQAALERHGAIIRVRERC